MYNSIWRQLLNWLLTKVTSLLLLVPYQRTGISYVEAGSIDQPICDRRGDLICADWGYAYLASTNGSGKSVSLGDYYGMKESFVKNGTLATTKAKWTTRKEGR